MTSYLLQTTSHICTGQHSSVAEYNGDLSETFLFFEYKTIEMT